MDLMELLLTRRSIRKYTGERISEKNLEKILQAGLASASGRNRKPWELVVVQDREMLEKLSHCRTGAAKMLEKAGCDYTVLVGGGGGRADHFFYLYESFSRRFHPDLWICRQNLIFFGCLNKFF